MRTGIQGLEGDLARQRQAVAGRSAPYERALSILPAVLSGPPGRYLEAAWEHRRFSSGSERPLLLLAALRDDALAGGPDHPLFEGFAAVHPDAGAVTADALFAALGGSRERVFDALAHRDVRIGETSRAVAWLWPAALAGASRGARALAIAGIGAGAGLGLVADALPSIWTAGAAPLDVAADVHAVARLGLDPKPLDALRADDARWLRACVWPGERAREERLSAALEAFRAARLRPDAPMLVPVAPSNVPARLDLLSAAAPGVLAIAYQAAASDVLEPAEREEYEHGMREWLAAHPPGTALWTALEPGAGDGDAPLSLVARVRAPSGEVRSMALARCDLRTLSVEPRDGAPAELRALLRADGVASARAP